MSHQRRNNSVLSVPAILALLVFAEVLLSTYVRCANEIPRKKLSVWIEGEQIEPFAGVALDIEVVSDGEVVALLRDAYFDNHLPVLPPEVNRVQISWLAPDDWYLYKFTDLRSLDPGILYDPLLSISQYGTIPRNKEDFEIVIPCTGKTTGVASMYIVLKIDNFKGKAIPGSPIKLHLRKRCIAFQSKTVCPHTCKNSGTCSDFGQCECKNGFYGTQCEFAACLPECMNNGTCVRPGQCVCSEGFLGHRCEMAICKKACLYDGRCVQPNKCDCDRDHYGDYCQHEIGTCEIPCKNGGTCTKEDKCQCSNGYIGRFCQTPICNKSCGVHGRCKDVDTCECFRGWRGKHCNRTVNPRRSTTARRKRKKKKQGGQRDGEGPKKKRVNIQSNQSTSSPSQKSIARMVARN